MRRYQNVLEILMHTEYKPCNPRATNHICHLDNLNGMDKQMAEEGVNKLEKKITNFHYMS